MHPARAWAKALKKEAFRLGFDAVGIARVGETPYAAEFLAWLEASYHGEMAYMARRAQARLDPRALLPEAQSIVVLARNYYVEPPDPSWLTDPSRGRIARYAWGWDYHEVLRPKLFALDAFLRSLSGRTTYAKAYVDTGPVLERAWAFQAGLGFFGKNTCLILPKRGSWYFLGVLIVPEVLDPDPSPLVVSSHPPLWQFSSGRGGCGACARCLVACPTAAFPAPYVLDARRCISYLTIEHRGPIPPALRPLMGNWIFGCDVCQDVCPWNERFARPSDEEAFRPRPDQVAPKLLDLLALDEVQFRRRFRGTPLMRPKRRGLLRNVCVAIGNWGDPVAVPHLARTLQSDPEPLVRGHAAWALGRIGTREAKRALSTALQQEDDPYVREEILSALEGESPERFSGR